MISSEVFKMGQGAMLARLYALHGRIWSVGTAAVISALIIWWLVTTDLRLLICALIVLFIIVPMVMAFLYINYALAPEVAYNVLPHRLTLTEEGVEVAIFPRRDSDEPTEENSPEESEDIPDEEIYGEPALTRLISYDAIERFTILPAGVSFNVRPAGFLYIPQSAFTSAKLFQTFIEDLLNKQKR